MSNITIYYLRSVSSFKNEKIVELNGRLKKCGVISSRLDVGVKEMEGWTARLLPSGQWHYGMMDHEEGMRKNVTRKVVGFFLLEESNWENWKNFI